MKLTKCDWYSSLPNPHPPWLTAWMNNQLSKEGRGRAAERPSFVCDASRGGTTNLNPRSTLKPGGWILMTTALTSHTSTPPRHTQPSPRLRSCRVGFPSPSEWAAGIIHRISRDCNHERGHCYASISPHPRNWHFHLAGVKPWAKLHQTSAPELHSHSKHSYLPFVCRTRALEPAE